MEVLSNKVEEKQFSQTFTFRNSGMGLYSCEATQKSGSSLSVIVKSKGQLICKILGEDDLVDVQFTWANNEKTSFLIGSTFYTRVFHSEFQSLELMNEMVQQTYRDSISKHNLSDEIIGPYVTLKKYQFLDQDGNPDLEALLSRNLIAILLGAPHVIPYGIVQVFL